MNQLTICIPNLNAGPFLKLAILSVRRFIPGVPIWVNDAGSLDGSDSWGEANSDRFTRITGPHGLQIDQWTSAVSTKYMLAIDSDVEVIEPDPVRDALTVMESDGSVGAIDGTRYNVHGTPIETDSGELVQQGRIDPSFTLIRVSASRAMLANGHSWRRKVCDGKLFDDGGWMKWRMQDAGIRHLHCERMMEGHIHYGNVGWARNPAAPFSALKRYVSNRDQVEDKLKTAYGTC